MATTEEILNQLLSLPLDTRAQLAQKLLESLQPQTERNRQLWTEEIESRLDAYERGELLAVPGEEVFARLREKFPKRRRDIDISRPRNSIRSRLPTFTSRVNQVLALNCRRAGSDHQPHFRSSWRRITLAAKHQEISDGTIPVQRRLHVDPEEVLIVALQHHSRDPRRWQDRVFE